MIVNDKQEVVAIILARGGSKGIPGKNTKQLAGRPFISYVIEQALTARLVDRVIITTDSEEIALIAEAYGAEVPFIRPACLAGDYILWDPVIEHALRNIEDDSYSADIVIPLSPTFIFRPPDLINRVVSKTIDNPDLNGCITMRATHNDIWIEKDGELQNMTIGIEHKPRQFRQPIYMDYYGLATAIRADIARTSKRLSESVGLVEVSDDRVFIDIDNPFDFWLAEKVMTEHWYKEE